MSALAIPVRGENPDAASLRVRRFLSSVQLLDGNCFCGHVEVHTGKDLVTEYALLLTAEGDGAERPLSVAECCAVLSWLAAIEPKVRTDCFGHSGNETVVGFQIVLGWVTRELRKAVQS